MILGNNPTSDRSKLGTKRHILTDKDGIPLSIVISSVNTYDVKMVTDVDDSAVIKRPIAISKTKNGRNRKQYHLCLDKAYNSKPMEKELIRRGYVLYIRHKRKRGEVMTEAPQLFVHKKYSSRRWVVERTNSWHNRFRKLFTRYEKNVENYLGLVEFSCYIIIYRKIILG